MASTVTIDTTGGRFVEGAALVRKGTLNLGTYASGGIAVTAAQFELGILNDLEVRPSGGYVFEYLPSTGKIKAYRQKDPGATGGADIPLPEVGSVDISSITPRFRAHGT